MSVPTFVFHSFFPYHPSSVVHFQCGFKGGVGIQAADTFIPLALPHYTPAEIPSAFLLPLQHVDLELALTNTFCSGCPKGVLFAYT